MSERLISDAAASAYLLRQWLQHDARRAAAMILWGVYSPGEALEELQGLARLADIRAGRLQCSTYDVSRRMLIEEYRRQAACHADTEQSIYAAVGAALRAGMGTEAAANTAAQIATTARLPPPPYTVTRAIEAALSSVRRRQRRAA